MMFNRTSAMCSSNRNEESVSSAISTTEQEEIASNKTNTQINKSEAKESWSKSQLLPNTRKLESDNRILSSCLEYNARTLQANRSEITNSSKFSSTPALNTDNDKHIIHAHVHHVQKLQNLLLRASARHVSTSEREHAMREILSILSANSHGSMKEAINSVSSYLQEVNNKVKTMEKSKKDAVQLQEQAVYAKCEKFFEGKIRSLLREQQMSLNKIAQLESSLMTMREERDNDLVCAKHDIMERLEEYERREHDMTYYRRLIATVYKTNEKITRYNEELEALLRHHCIDLPPVPEPDLFAFTAKANTNAVNYRNNQITNVESASAPSADILGEENSKKVDKEINNVLSINNHKLDTNDASVPSPSLPQTTRALREQVTDNFIAASKVEMNEARLSLEQQLLHCAFDERSAYKLQVNGLKQENANLRFEVHRLQEEVSTLSKYIHEKKYRGATYSEHKEQNESKTTNSQTNIQNAAGRFNNNHNKQELEYEENNNVEEPSYETNEVEEVHDQAKSFNRKFYTTEKDHVHSRHSQVNNTLKHNSKQLTRSDTKDDFNTVDNKQNGGNKSDTTVTIHILNSTNDAAENRSVQHLTCADENAMSRYDGPLTPRPCNIPFAIHNELGISLQSSTSDMVSELATVSINLKHQLNSSLLRLRQLTTFSEWVNEESLQEIDEIANEVNVIPTIGSALWEHSPHFLRTRVEPDVNNLGWTAAQTASLLYQFFVHFTTLRHECVNYEDDKMIAPRVHQLSEHRELLIPPLNRLDATREQMAADEQCVPVGYVVSWFITKFLSHMTADEVKNSPYTAPGTSQVWLVNNKSNNSNMQRRVMEIEFARFAYNLWYCAQKFSKTQPLCELFVDVVTGTLPISVFTIMEQIVTVIELEIQELDVDRSGYFTYHKLANMLIRMLNDWDAHSLYSGTLAIAETFAENKISLSNGVIHKNLLLASERLMFVEHNTESVCENGKEKNTTLGEEENVLPDAASDKNDGDNDTENNTKVNVNSVVIDDKQSDNYNSHVIERTQSSKPHREFKFVYDVHKIWNSSVFVRYWRHLIVERVRVIFEFTEQLLAPLIEESEVIFGVYMLPVKRARTKLHELDNDNELKAESFVNDTFLSFQRSHTNTHAMRSILNIGDNTNKTNKDDPYYDEESKNDERSFDETQESEMVNEVSALDAGIPRLPVEYLSLLQSRKDVLHARQTTAKMMLQEIFESAVKPLTRFDERVHFPFRAMRNDAIIINTNNTDFHINNSNSNHMKELEVEESTLYMKKMNERQSKNSSMKLLNDNQDNIKSEKSNAQQVFEINTELRKPKLEGTSGKIKEHFEMSHAAEITSIDEFDANVKGNDVDAAAQTITREKSKAQESRTLTAIQKDKTQSTKSKVKLPKLKQNIRRQINVNQNTPITATTTSTKNRANAKTRNAFNFDDNGIEAPKEVASGSTFEKAKIQLQSDNSNINKEHASRHCS